MLELRLESMSLLENTKKKTIMSYNSIGPSTKKQVAPSEKVAPIGGVEKEVEL